MMGDIMTRTNFFSPERYKKESEHIKGSHAGTDCAYPIQQGLSMRTSIDLFKNQIFTVVARKARDSSNRNTANQKCPSGDWHFSQEATHLADILFFTHAVDHTSGARKSRALKKAWVIKWKMPAPYAPTPTPKNI